MLSMEDSQDKSSRCRRMRQLLSVTKPGMTKPNWKIICLMFVNVFGSAYSICFLFPLLPSMILHFGFSEDRKGQYVGIVASSMFAGRIFGSYLWGWLSDKFGRRPILSLSLILISMSNVGFGFSTSLTMAIVFRFLNGLFNGVMAIVRTVLYETSDSTNQAIGMGSLSTGWGVGIIIGPLISGYLSRPAEQYPHLFTSAGIFGVYPYLLPSLISALFSLVPVFFDIFVLDETKHQRSDAAVKEDVIDGKPDLPVENLKRAQSVPFIEKERSCTLLTQSCASLHTLDDSSGIVFQIMSPHAVDEATEKKGHCCYKWKILELLRMGDVRNSIALYSMFSFAVIGWAELFTIFASTERRLEGLAFNEAKIGSVAGYSAVPLVLIQFWMFPKLERKIGSLKVFLYGNCVIVFTSTAVVALRIFINHSTLLWVMLIIFRSFQEICGNGCFAAISLFVNNAVAPEFAGQTNGLSQMLTSIMRTLAPLLSGGLFSWSVVSGAQIGFPFDVSCTFIVFGAIFLINSLIALRLPQSIQQQTKKR